MNKIEKLFEAGLISEKEYILYLRRKLPFMFND